jgi:hypothetical protein
VALGRSRLEEFTTESSLIAGSLALSLAVQATADMVCGPVSSKIQARLAVRDALPPGSGLIALSTRLPST